MSCGKQMFFKNFKTIALKNMGYAQVIIFAHQP